MQVFPLETVCFDNSAAAVLVQDLRSMMKLSVELIDVPRGSFVTTVVKATTEGRELSIVCCSRWVSEFISSRGAGGRLLIDSEVHERVG